MSDYIRTTKDTDVYPTHLSNLGKGGYHQVNSLTDRNNIPPDRLLLGMMVYVIDESKLFILTDVLPSVWTEFQSGVAGSSGTSGIHGSAGTSGATYGTSGTSGESGSSGETGTSGTSGATYGTAGTSGATYGTSGTSGAPGSEGSSGTSGETGTAGTSGVSGEEYIFPTNLTVSIAASKTFGKYINGSTIPCAGKTPSWVIQDAIFESMNPTVNIASSTVVEFNQTNISNVLNLNYTIDSPKVVSSAILEYKFGEGTYTTLTTSTTKPLTFTHETTDVPSYNTTPFNYRYTVTDSDGKFAFATLSIQPKAYSAPTAALTVTPYNTLLSPETNNKRETGNVKSSVAGSISSTNVYVPMTKYTVQYSYNNLDNWTGVPGLINVPISGNPVTIPSIPHIPINLASTSVKYRVVTTDAYQVTTSTALSTINFKNLIFFGTSSAVPITSDMIRALGDRTGLLNNRIIFSDEIPWTDNRGNYFILSTGNFNSIFTIAIPAPLDKFKVLDEQALFSDVTICYVKSSLTSIGNYSGASTNYNIYTMHNDIPFLDDPTHNHYIYVN